MKDNMTVIELLSKIANKEEVPKRIKYGIYEYEWVLDSGNHKWFYARPPLVGYCMLPFNEDLNLGDWETLNSTVTVLEYDKPLKELEHLNCTYIDINDPCEVSSIKNDYIIADIQTLQNWINKIIKEINKEGK